MNSLPSLTGLGVLLLVSVLSLGCRSETKRETSSDQGAGQTIPSNGSRDAKEPPVIKTIAKIDVGPAGLSMEPLESAASGATENMFESLSSDKTGIDFSNPVDYSHPQQYLFATVVTCGGVAIGDVDNDGWPDVFFTSGPNKNRLFRQTSPMKFEDVTDKAKLDSGDAWSAGATMADIDNDGDLDIYICNFDTPGFFGERTVA